MRRQAAGHGRCRRSQRCRGKVLVAQGVRLSGRVNRTTLIRMTLTSTNFLEGWAARCLDVGAALVMSSSGSVAPTPCSSALRHTRGKADRLSSVVFQDLCDLQGAPLGQALVEAGRNSTCAGCCCSAADVKHG